MSERKIEIDTEGGNYIVTCALADQRPNANGRFVSSDEIRRFVESCTDASGHFRHGSSFGEITHGDDNPVYVLPDTMMFVPKCTYSGISVDEDGNREFDNLEFVSFDIIKRPN